MQHLVYIKNVGKNLDGNYQYSFYLSDHQNIPVKLFSDDYDKTPYCLNCQGEMLEDIQTTTVTVVTKYKLITIQENCCMSFKNCVDQVCAIAYEDISDYEEYPEEGRLFFMYGETMDVITSKLSKKNVNIS